jgi:hypothetical protein
VRQVSQATWDRLSEEASADDQVVGLVLTGGRGKGVATPLSDWDCLLVVADEAMPRWRRFDFGDLDVTLVSEAEFADYAEPGTAFSWRAYDFAHLSPDVDRRGFGALLSSKGSLTAQRGRQIAEEHLGAALNSLYRATKNRRDGNEEATLLDLAEMTGYYLTSLFALDGRLRPYNKLLRWDLERAALVTTELTAELLFPLLTKTLQGDLDAAWLLADRLADGFRRAGVTEVLDSWADHLDPVRPDE